MSYKDDAAKSRREKLNHYADGGTIQRGTHYPEMVERFSTSAQNLTPQGRKQLGLEDDDDASVSWSARRPIADGSYDPDKKD